MEPISPPVDGIRLRSIFFQNLAEIEVQRQSSLGLSRPHSSQITDCMRKQWFTMTGQEVTNPPDEHGIYARNQGHFNEEAVAPLLENRDAGIALVRTFPGVYGQVAVTPDRVLQRHKAFGWERAFPVELKYLSASKFVDIATKGVQQSSHNYWVQCMFQAALLDTPGTLIVVFCKDPSEAKKQRTIKLRKLNGDAKKIIPGADLLDEIERWEHMPTDLYEEWVPLDMETVEFYSQRGDWLMRLADTGTPAQKEFIPGTDWQCNYCDFRKACEDVDRVTEDE